MASNEPRYVSLLTRNTLALVLAGGRGTRLGGLTEWRAKPAVPFGGKFRIIDFALSNCINSGIRRIGILTQYKAHSLIRHIQRGWGFVRGQFGEFVELMPASQRTDDSWYKGTADAVIQNLDIIRAHAPQFVLILAGDHVYRMDYGKMLAAHVASGADVSVGCVEVPLVEARALGVMTVDGDDRITGFTEKPDDPQAMPTDPTRALASMGIYVFGTDFLMATLLKDFGDSESSHDFGKDLIPELVPRAHVMAHRFSVSAIRNNAEDSGYWRDVGTIDAFWEANLDLTKVTPALNLYDDTWSIWTDQDQRPPAKFIFDDGERRGIATESIVAAGCIVSGAYVRRSVLFSNVHVEARSHIEESVILPDVRIGQNVHVRRAVIDKRCILPDNFVVGADPEFDAQHFERTEHGITLVTPTMLGQTVHALT